MKNTRAFQVFFGVQKDQELPGENKKENHNRQNNQGDFANGAVPERKHFLILSPVVQHNQLRHQDRHYGRVQDSGQGQFHRSVGVNCIFPGSEIPGDDQLVDLAAESSHHRGQSDGYGEPELFQDILFFQIQRHGSKGTVNQQRKDDEFQNIIDQQSRKNIFQGRLDRYGNSNYAEPDQGCRSQDACRDDGFFKANVQVVVVRRRHG